MYHLQKHINFLNMSIQTCIHNNIITYTYNHRIHFCIENELSKIYALKYVYDNNDTGYLIGIVEVPRPCEDFGLIANGIKSQNGDKFDHKETVHYKCNKGYKLIGSSSRTCLAPGIWSHKVPRCMGMYINIYILLLTC